MTSSCQVLGISIQYEHKKAVPEPCQITCKTKTRINNVNIIIMLRAAREQK